MTSDPAGAQVFVGNRFAGTTPARLIVKRRDRTIVVRLEKAGFAPANVTLVRTISGWVAVDLAVSLNPNMGEGPRWPASALLPGVVTLGIDFLTGAAYEFRPVHVVLEPAR